MSGGRFALDLSKLVAKAKGDAGAVVRKVVLDIGSRIVEKTPVGDPNQWKRGAPPGYVGGRARGSWQYGQGAPVAADPGTVDESGQASIDRLTAVLNADPFQVHYVTSTVPYMRRLEYEAWSRQAPDGMVRVTILEYQKFVEEAVKGLK